MKARNLIKILLMNFIITMPLFGIWSDDPVNVGSVSFIDADWDNSYNISFSKHRISELTNFNKAVVLYLYDACFT